MDKTHLNSTDWLVRSVTIDAARPLVDAWHYSGGAANTATYLHGLMPATAFFDNECEGVAWWMPPTKLAAIATAGDADWEGVLSLSRLVVGPTVPTNGASFLLGRSMRLINRTRWPVLVTYADEWRGHTGAIYRATNWTYVGKTKPERVYVRDGRMMGRKRGRFTYTHAEMIGLGFECAGKYAKHKFVHDTRKM